MLLARRVVIVAAVCLFFLATSWGIVFAYADRMVSVLPGDLSAINESHPDVSISLGKLPAGRLVSASATIDGRLQSGVKLLPLGLTVRPVESLSDGKHTIEVRLRYSLLAAKDIKKKWSFVVDTKAPDIALAGGRLFIATDRSSVEVTGTVESGAAVRYSFNGAKAALAARHRSADFSFKLQKLENTNKLVIMASDVAGNTRSLLMPVLKDVDNPVVSAITPAEGGVVRASAPMVAAELTDAGSKVVNSRLMIDGQQAIAKDGQSASSLAYLGGLLSDGTHKARVEAVDLVGHSVAREWNFTVDTRRIVVDRGARRLYFYRNGGLFKVYPVAVGMPAYPTPRGSFHIVSRQRNPVWHNPGSAWGKDMPKTIPPGPGNPLGTRAIGINARAIFIHGTYAASSIGSAASHGCIRMLINDNQELFEMVGLGMPVEIIN